MTIINSFSQFMDTQFDSFNKSVPGRLMKKTTIYFLFSPMPTAFLALLRSESWFSLELSVIASPARWVLDFWLCKG